YWVASALALSTIISLLTGIFVQVPKPLRIALFFVEYPVGLLDDKLEPLLYPRSLPGHAAILLPLHFLYWLGLGLLAGFTHKWVASVEPGSRSTESTAKLHF